MSRPAQFLLAFCLFSSTLFGQFQAAVQGSVTDSTGAVAPGATVTLTNKETSRQLTTNTTGDGFYRFNGLAPGVYSIQATKEGFQTATVDNLQVNAEQVQAANIILSPGQVSQSVTVSATETPALATENADISANITAQAVQTLPQFGRDPYSLLRLTPGVFGDEARSGNGGAVNLVNTTGPEAAPIESSSAW